MLVPGLAYFVVAKCSLYLAIPPSQAVAVWPAAGIALGALLVAGSRVLPGLCTALFVYNLTIWLDSSTSATLVSSLFMCLLLTIGPVLQAVFSARLVEHFLGAHNPLIEDRSIAMFMLLAGPVGCLCAASLSMSVLLAYDIMPLSAFMFNWLNWWVGDIIGTVLIAPIIVLLFSSAGDGAENRKYSVGIPLLLMMSLVIAVFCFVQQNERTELEQTFDKEVYARHQHISTSINDSLQILYFMKSFFEASTYVSENDFRGFTRQSLLVSPHIQALEWIPKVSHEQRGLYEQQGDSQRLITEPDQQGGMQRAADRAFYLPIKYAEPRNKNRAAMGYDVNFNLSASKAIQHSRETQKPTATNTFKLIQETENQHGMVIYLPVFDSVARFSVGSETSEFRGVVAAVLRIQDFIETISSVNGRNDLLSQRVSDLTEGPDSLYQSADMAASLKLHEWLQLYESRAVSIAGRLWQIDYFPNQNFVDNHAKWYSWMVLIAGMLFTILLSSWLLSLTGRNIQIKRVVSEKTGFLLEEIERRKGVEAEMSKLSLAVEHSPNMVVITDAKGLIEYVNPRFSLITGYQADEVLGKNIAILHSGDLDGCSYQQIWDVLLIDHEWRGDVLNCRKNGEFYWAELHISAIMNQQSVPTHYVSVHQDVTESKLIAEKISYQASHDLLTGLINRREFERRLDQLLITAKLEKLEHAFCFMDLDQFKIVNDTSGHVAGDELLRQLGSLLQEKIRKSDTIARLGGDEFGILMEQCSLHNAQRMAEQIRQTIEQFKFSWNERTYAVGASIGLVRIDQYSLNGTEVFKQADSACYLAKDAGRNRIHLYQEDDEVQQRRAGELHWVSDINDALAEDRFELHGQLIKPIQSTNSKPAVEILLRLKSRDGELVLPGAFLPAAERYNIATRIDQWVISHVFDWFESNPEVIDNIDSCAINLSGQSLGDKSILEMISSQLARQILPAEMIKFEITETSAISNLAEAKSFINAVKKQGCRFSLDDFGSGLSSFAYLKHLSVDILKIDGMFVKDIMDDEINFAMVKSINEVGHVMGMSTIAEFVENDEIQQRLAGIGVDYAQGYGVCRPMPLLELMQHPLIPVTAASQRQPGQVSGQDYG